MRVIFMGTPDFAVPALEALIASPRHAVSLAVTQPDRPKGRSGAPSPSDVKRCALSHGIPLFQPARIRSPEAAERLRAECADVIVVAAFGQILPREILELPPYGCINIHGSLLPLYRGAAPVQWAVIDGRRESGVTIMRMNEGLDTGDILLQESTPLAPDETGGSLYDRLAQMGGPLLLTALEGLEAGTLIPVPQDESKATHVGKIDRSMGEIDWSRSASDLEHLIRGLNPRPGAFTHWNGKLLKLWTARAAESSDSGTQTDDGQAASPAPGPQAGTERPASPAPGTVLKAAGAELLVQTGRGCLFLTELQLEGKKRLPVSEFLRGCRIREGDLLL